MWELPSTPSASLSRGTSRCQKAQGKVYTTAEPCLADHIPPTLLQDGDHFGCPFHADHPQDIFLSHSRSPQPQRPSELSSSGQKLHRDSLHPFAQDDVSLEQLFWLPGGMLQDHSTSTVQGTLVAALPCLCPHSGPSPAAPSTLGTHIQGVLGCFSASPAVEGHKTHWLKETTPISVGKALPAPQAAVPPLCPRQQHKRPS